LAPFVLSSASAKQRQEVIDEWKAAKVYPFPDPPTTATEVRERRMFNLVALAEATARIGSRWVAHIQEAGCALGPQTDTSAALNRMRG
jgi:hypothetical protein